MIIRTKSQVQIQALYTYKENVYDRAYQEFK